MAKMQLTLIVAIAWLAGLAIITLLVVDSAKYPLIAAVRSAGRLPSLLLFYQYCTNSSVYCNIHYWEYYLSSAFLWC